MKIYIVEDDPEIRELESYALKSSGYETMEFAEGSSFFEAIRREKPALVLLDVMLPGQDGLSILKQLRSQADTMSLPVILVTAVPRSWTPSVALISVRMTISQSPLESWSW